MNPQPIGASVLGHGSALLNMAGHSTGAVVFAIFLVLLARDRAGSRLRGGTLTFAAAALAFVWNLGAFLLIAFSPESPFVNFLMESLSFSSLSLLAPVLLHLSLGHRGALVVAGYATGAAAVGLHLAEVVAGRPQLHVYALELMTVGLGAVTLLAAIQLLRAGSLDRRTLLARLSGAALLFVFIGTYAHVGLEHGAHAWSSELILHHASVPLALLIIVHNHRFVLMDALIRFCANVILAGLFALACLQLIRANAAKLASAGAIQMGWLILTACAMLLLFALARDRLQRLLTRIVFRHGDAAVLGRELRSRASDFKEEAPYLDWALDLIAAFMRASRLQAVPGELAGQLARSGFTGPLLCSDLPELRKKLEDLTTDVVVPLRFSSTETGFLLLGRRRGGQPYLSEDLRHLAQFASLVADQVQAFREAELRRLAARAELRALQAQINPHFLFNALNTLYGLVPREAAVARQTVANLAELFRFFLRNDESDIPLEAELRIVEAYLQIEKLRLAARLATEIQVEPEALRVRIPPLSIQPLVENAVKHGIASQPAGGVVRLEARVKAGALHVLVEDTGPGLSADGPGSTGGAGVGLQNVRRRLKLAYGPDADLRIQSSSRGTSVRFTIPDAGAVSAG